MTASKLYIPMSPSPSIVVLPVFALNILFLFIKVRHFDPKILTSAGIIGIFVGFVEQRSIAPLLAGLHLSVSHPIRIDDVVTVENEWGRIEEITPQLIVNKMG